MGIWKKECGSGLKLNETNYVIKCHRNMWSYSNGKYKKECLVELWNERGCEWQKSKHKRMIATKMKRYCVMYI